jgi:DNA-binding response OmpR family regulator
MTSSVVVILLVEGARPASSLSPALTGRGYQVVRASNSKEAIGHTRTDAPALAVVNATSLHTDGLRICADLKTACDTLPIILIVRTGTDPGKIDCADAVLVRPFTSRKLLNRVLRLLPDSVGEVLHAGEISFNPESRWLRVVRTECHLTPMKARLLEEFMRHPGEVLSREYLMRTVWQTEYLGDTRTVEVHVRWLRELVEADPTRPRYLQTIRGIGYIFRAEPAV